MAMAKTTRTYILTALSLVILILVRPTYAFVRYYRFQTYSICHLHSNSGTGIGFGSSSNNIKQRDKNKDVGDSLREATGIRPSIHPITINAIAESLKARALQNINKNKKKGSSNSSSIDGTETGVEKEKEEENQEEDNLHFCVTDTVSPLEVMITAGQFASDAIQARQEVGEETNDGMKLNQGEEQTVAGRVVGVIMRLDDLEDELIDRTSDVAWVSEYNEWSSFGVLEDERTKSDDDDDEEENKTRIMNKVHKQIIDNPLFCINRAECLLGIFLHEVEIPQLEKLVNETVPDGSTADFLDADRLEVIIPPS